MTEAAAEHRPRSLDELAAMLGGLAPTPDEIAAFVPLEPKPTDVVITPFGKCGTTMLQQMFHQLRMAQGTDAPAIDEDFDDISRVLPWFEQGVAIAEVDLNAEQKAEPRGFKSHLHYEGLPPGMRYVVSLRDPKEAYMSMYHFFEGWLFEPGTIQPDAFLPVWMRGGPTRVDYFDHLLSWWARRDADDTLLLSYRWILAHKREAIRRLAAFCGLDASDAVVDLVERATARDWMLAHKHLFDDHLMRALFHRKAGIPMVSDSSKVRGRHEVRVEIPASAAEVIDAQWAERIAPVTGHADFASLAADLHGD